MNNATFSSIVGNKSLCSRLCRSINDNTLSHAYILEGGEGSGRHTIALNTIAAISCEARQHDGETIPCGKCLSCKKIFENKSPDIIYVGLEGDKSTIGVDAVRLIKNGIYLPPTDLSVKAYIIDHAEQMTPQAQNAFLLTLEEPPSYVMFFLICNSTSSLLETVKSRAPTLRTEKLDADEIKSYLLSNSSEAVKLKEKSPNEFSELLCCSSGSIGVALSLLDIKKRKQVFENRETAKNFINLASGKQNSDKLQLVFALGTKRQEICERLSYIQYALRDLIVLKKSFDAPLCFYEDRDEASELSTHFTLRKLLEIYSATEIATDDLKCNANVKLTLINMLKMSKVI